MEKHARIGLTKSLEFSYFELFRKKAILKFLGKHVWWRPQFASWNITEEKLQGYCPSTYLKLLTTSILPTGEPQSTVR